MGGERVQTKVVGKGIRSKNKENKTQKTNTRKNKENQNEKKMHHWSVDNQRRKPRRTANPTETTHTYNTRNNKKGKHHCPYLLYERLDLRKPLCLGRQSATLHDHA
jgi:hypothetical protein